MQVGRQWLPRRDLQSPLASADRSVNFSHFEKGWLSEERKQNSFFWGVGSIMFRLLAMNAYFLMGACAHSITVASTPKEIDVYALSINDNRRGVVGKTPVSLAPPQQGLDLHYLEFSKSGYMPKVALIPFFSSLDDKTEVKVNLRKKDAEWFKEAMRGTFVDETDQVVRQFLELQGTIIQGNDEECERLLATLGKSYGNIAAYYALAGAYYWKKNSLNQAKLAYERLLELDPTYKEAKRMLNVISVMLGSQ